LKPTFVFLVIILRPLLAVLVPLWYAGEGCWACFAGDRIHRMYHLCSGCIVRRAEAKEQLEIARQEAEVRNREQEAKARAQCIFEDLEKGVLTAGLQKTASKSNIAVRSLCSFDTPLPARETIEIFCLPVVREDDKSSGLLLRLADVTADRYERLGTFTALHDQLRKLPHPSKEDIFILI